MTTAEWDKQDANTWDMWIDGDFAGSLCRTWPQRYTLQGRSLEGDDKSKPCEWVWEPVKALGKIIAPDGASVRVAKEAASKATKR